MSVWTAVSAGFQMMQDKLDQALGEVMNPINNISDSLLLRIGRGQRERGSHTHRSCDH